MKILSIVILATVMVGAARAQSTDGRALQRDPYITSTGATVDRPGQSQSGGTTGLDRGIQRQDNKIDSSICKGC